MRVPLSRMMDSDFFVDGAVYGNTLFIYGVAAVIVIYENWSVYSFFETTSSKR